MQKPSTGRLIACILWTMLTLLMIACIVINVINENFVGLPIAIFAAIIDGVNAGRAFVDYQHYRSCEKIFYM